MGFLSNYFQIIRQESKLLGLATKKYIKDKQMGKDAKFDLESPPWMLISFIIIVLVILIIVF